MHLERCIADVVLTVAADFIELCGYLLFLSVYYY